MTYLKYFYPNLTPTLIDNTMKISQVKYNYWASKNNIKAHSIILAGINIYKTNRIDYFLIPLTVKEQFYSYSVIII